MNPKRREPIRESEFHEWLRSLLPPAEGVTVGIGDDAAVLDASGPVAAACDILVEGVHYDPRETLPAQIGAKAVNRNLSDMAAMGLQPRWLLLSAAIPPGIPEASLKEMVLAMKAAGERFGAVLVGGDTVRSTGPLVLDVTVLGPVGELEPVLRTGAAPGDRILVTGELGGSILGKHLLFTPRVKEGLFLNRRHCPSAMIDVSDGLEMDLFRLLDASRAGALLDGDAIPVSDAARRLAARTGRDPLVHALTDGEDFELLFTLPPERADALLDDPDLFFPVTAIGMVTTADKRAIMINGKEEPLKGEGFDHIF
jgi:thiamine-monophosphate kinase